MSPTTNPNSTESTQTIYPLRELALSIAKMVEQKDKTYGSSWMKRGGTGAYMMLARKWDRIENQAKTRGWDIFKTAEELGGKEGVVDDLFDLVGYLLLVINHAEKAAASKVEGKAAAKRAMDDGVIPSFPEVELTKKCACEVCKIYSSRPLPQSASMFFIDRVNDLDLATPNPPPNSDESVLSDPIGDAAFALNAFKEGFLFSRSLEGFEG